MTKKSRKISKSQKTTASPAAPPTRRPRTARSLGEAARTAPRVSGTIIPRRKGRTAAGLASSADSGRSARGDKAPCHAPKPRAKAGRLPPMGTVMVKRDRDGGARCQCAVEEGGFRYGGK